MQRKTRNFLRADKRNRILIATSFVAQQLFDGYLDLLVPFGRKRIESKLIIIPDGFFNDPGIDILPYCIFKGFFCLRLVHYYTLTIDPVNIQRITHDRLAIQQRKFQFPLQYPIVGIVKNHFISRLCDGACYLDSDGKTIERDRLMLTLQRNNGQCHCSTLR